MEKEIKSKCKDSVMQCIKEQHLTPKPKWTFLFHDYFVMAISFAALLIGSLSLSLFLHSYIENDWDMYTRMGEDFTEHALKTFPYLWLLFIVVFIFYSFFVFSSSEKGYHYMQSRIITMSIVTSIFLGFGAYLVGIGEYVDDYLSEMIPYYQMVTGNHACRWQNPEHGLLAGMILSTGTSPLMIVDFNGETWTTTGDDTFPPDVERTQGTRIKIIGSVTDHRVFEIQEIRRFHGRILKQPCHQ